MPPGPAAGRLQLVASTVNAEKLTQPHARHDARRDTTTRAVARHVMPQQHPSKLCLARRKNTLSTMPAVTERRLARVPSRCLSFLITLYTHLPPAAAAPTLQPGGPCTSDEDCSGRGACITAVCLCERAWTGAFCSVSSCPRACSGHGSCSLGACTCSDGWSGVACDVPSLPCPHGCSGRGHGCIAGGACLCDEGYVGVDCSQAACIDSCSHHGTCRQGACVCEEGFSGAACEQPLCPDGCSGHGYCAAPGRCVCAPGWGGPGCVEEA